jgi:hypothetical protein
MRTAASEDVMIAIVVPRTVAVSGTTVQPRLPSPANDSTGAGPVDGVLTAPTLHLSRARARA